MPVLSEYRQLKNNISKGENQLRQSCDVEKRFIYVVFPMDGFKKVYNKPDGVFT
ncbi:MAG: hypothetical protein WB792_03325 [Desulfobacterales bacterium]